MSSSHTNQPSRSISLPSRHHPLVPRIEDHLSRLTSFNSDAESESKISSVGYKLNDLKELYDCLHDFILLPQNQQKLVQFPVATSVDELINGSLKLLDVCSITKDVLSQVKEHIQEIQSCFRRRSNSVELSIVSDETIAYINMRKKTKIICKKCLKEVKGIYTMKKYLDLKENGDNFAIINVLTNVEGVTAQVFESLLEVVSCSKAQSHRRSASLSIIMCNSSMYEEGEEEENGNEFEDVDSSLSSLMIVSKKRFCVNGVEIEKLRRKMVKLESSLQDLEEVLEGLFRCLVRSRATLLNILSQ